MTLKNRVARLEVANNVRVESPRLIVIAIARFKNEVEKPIIGLKVGETEFLIRNGEDLEDLKKRILKESYSPVVLAFAIYEDIL